MTVYLVVAYDVSNDRRRARLAKRLEDFLPRVQMSVFEGAIPPARLPALRRAVDEIVDLEHDQVRIYTLCRGCQRNVGAVGATPLPLPAGRGAPDELVDS